jgi:hypothetical protein
VAPPNPSSVWKLTRFLLREATYAVPTAIAWMEGLTSANEPVANPGWLDWRFVVGRNTPAGTSEDKAVFGFHLVNITGGAVDTTWTAGDFATVKAASDTLATALKPLMATSHTIVQYRGYRRFFNSADPGPGLRTAGAGAFLDAGAPVYVMDVSSAGTAASNFPYQVSATATLKTAWPRHWGRIYLPGASFSIDGFGRIPAAFRVSYANAVKAFVSTLADSEFLVCVPVTQLEKATFHALLGVDQIVVDDVPDIQRRRRPKNVLARTVGV